MTQKLLEIVTVPIFFYFDEILKYEGGRTEKHAFFTYM